MLNEGTAQNSDSTCMSLVSSFTSSKLLRQIIFVASARALAHAFIFATTIITAKFFQSAEFGKVAFFVTLAQLTGMVVSFRIENAAMVLIHPHIRLQVFRLAYVLSLIATVIMTPVFSVYFCSIGKFSPLVAALFPVYVLMTSLVTYIWPQQLTAEHEIARLNGVIIVNALLSSALQIAVSVWNPTPDLLIVARVLAIAVAGLCAAPVLYLSFRQFNWRTDLRRLRRAARLAGAEIRFSLPTNILFGLSLHLPVFAFALSGRESDAGLFWLASALVLVPYTVVSASFRPVFVREMTREAKTPVKLAEYLTRTTLYASGLGIVGALAVFAGSYAIIKFFLGLTWLPAIDFSAWLCALLASLILQTPLSAASTTLRAQQDIMWQQAAHVIFRLGGFVLGAKLFASSLGGVAGYALAGMVVNIGFTFLLIRKLRRAAKASTGAVVAPS
jgi:O-antigen/teichoic acid export membrane protein